MESKGSRDSVLIKGGKRGDGELREMEDRNGRRVCHAHNKMHNVDLTAIARWSCAKEM